MNYKFTDTVLLVFSKAPVPGQVKTRLLPTLNHDQAAHIHQELCNNALQMATQADLCPIQLWCSPSTEHTFFTTARQNFSVSLHTQNGPNLGAKMFHALNTALQHYQHAILIGCDCPALNENHLQQAITALAQNHDIVLAPAEDGGYVLIGMNQSQPELFKNIAWGTQTVLSDTRERIANSELVLFELPELWDVDTPEDLNRWQACQYDLL